LQLIKNKLLAAVGKC